MTIRDQSDQPRKRVGTLPFLLVLVPGIVLVILAAHFLPWWALLIVLSLSALSRPFIWRNRLPPEWATNFSEAMERYLKEKHGYLRLILATALGVLGISFVGAARDYLFPLGTHGWSDRVTSLVLAVLGVVVVSRAVSVLRHRGRLRLRSSRQ